MGYDGSLKFDTTMDTGKFEKDAKGLDSIVKGLGVFKILEKGFMAVAASIDGAINRYDTLNKFPRVLQQMGYDAADASKATSTLAEGVSGLPTTLDDVVSTAQRLTVLSGNLETSVDTTLALNNAFLSSGSSAQDAVRGLNQYVQMLSSGKVDMDSWLTLQETMGYALTRVAETFGYVGESAQNGLYKALQSGEITFKDFNTRIIALDSGVGGFAEMARTSTGGIATAWTNMKTAIVRGTTGIIGSIDKGLSQTRFVSIEHTIGTMKDGILKSLSLVASAFGLVTRNADVLIPVIATLVGGFAAYKIVSTTAAALSGFNTTLVTAKALLVQSTGAVLMDTASHTMLTAALASETTAELVRAAAKKAGMTIDTAGNLITAKGAAATAAETAAVLANSGALTAKTVIVGLLTGGISVATAAQWLWNAAMHANPIGLIVVGVTALIAGIVALVSCLSKSNAAFDKEKDAVNDLREAHKAYADQIAKSAASAAEARESRAAEMKVNRDTVKSLQSLIAANDTLGTQNSAIAAKVASINSSMEGLGLAYDSTTGKLNMSAEALAAYMDSLVKVEEHQVAQAEYNRLLQEQATLQQRLSDAENKPYLYARMLADSIIDQGKYNELVKQNEEYINDLRLSIYPLNDALVTAKTSAEDSYNAQAEASVRAQQIRNNDIASVMRYADAWDMTAGQIIDAASRLGGGLDELAVNQAKMLTDSGVDITMVAKRWGMTVADVQAYMDMYQLTLQEASDSLSENSTKNGLSLDKLAKKHKTTAKAIRETAYLQGKSWQEYGDWMEESIAEYAKKFGISTEQIIKESSRLQGGFEEWVTVAEQKYRRATVAEQEYVNQIKAGNISINASYAERLESRRLHGEELNAVEQATLEQWKSLNQAAVDQFKAQQQDIVDTTEAGANKIVLSKQLSAKKILAIQEANNKATAEYVDNYNFIYSQIPITQQQYLGELDINSARFLKEMVAKWDKGGKEQWEQYVAGIEAGKATAAEKVGGAVQAMGDAVVDGAAAKEEEVRQAGINLADEVGAGMDESTAPSEASQAIANAVIEDLTGADYSGITGGIAAAISKGTSEVTASTKLMAIGFLGVCENLKSAAPAIATQMMSDISTAITAKQAIIAASFGTMGESLILQWNATRGKVSSIATQMMTDIYSSITIRTSIVGAAAAAVHSRIISALDSLPATTARIGSDMMEGIYRAMVNNEKRLYDKALEIARRIEKTFRDALDVHSPSRVMFTIFQYVMLGVYEGMESMEGRVYKLAEDISEGIVSRLNLTPSFAGITVERLRALSDANALGSKLSAMESTQGSFGDVYYNTNLTQNITSPKPLSPSEMTREGQDMLSRSQWQLP